MFETCSFFPSGKRCGKPATRFFLVYDTGPYARCEEHGNPVYILRGPATDNVDLRNVKEIDSNLFAVFRVMES